MPSLARPCRNGRYADDAERAEVHRQQGSSAIAHDQAVASAIDHGGTYAPKGSAQSLRAVSGPVMRSSTGSVDAMMASDAMSPATTIT